MAALKQEKPLKRCTNRRKINQFIYFNHAATSWPKPDIVSKSYIVAYKDLPPDEGRSTIKDKDCVTRLRKLICELVEFEYPERVIICPSATYALNQAIYGLNLRQGDHVITTCAEHNAVLRPLADLSHHGVKVDYLPCDKNGLVELIKIKEIINKSTRLVAITHASNVTGAINNIEEISDIVHKNNALLLVDACQTVGAIDVSIKKLGADLLAFSGHKWLHGPLGIGILIVGPNVNLHPLVQGGTGVQGEFEVMPEELPIGLEPGTQNYPAIIALLKAIEIHEREKVYKKLSYLREKILIGLKKLSNIEIYHPSIDTEAIPIFSLTTPFFPPQVLGEILYDSNIICRTGLHCAPKIHSSLSTWPLGTCRISIGWSNTASDIEYLLDVLKRIVSISPEKDVHFKEWNQGGTIEEAPHCIDHSIWNAHFNSPFTKKNISYLQTLGEVRLYPMSTTTLFILEVPNKYQFKGVIGCETGQFFLLTTSNWREIVETIERTFSLKQREINT